MISSSQSKEDESRERFSCMLAMISVTSTCSQWGGERSILCRVLDGREMIGVRSEDVAVLTSDELGHYSRLQNPRERALHCRARASLRRMLSREIGIPVAELCLVLDEHGKPRCMNMEAQGIDFSVSHSGDCAIVALGEAAGIGVDIETIPEVEPPATLVEAVFHEEELDQWLALPPEYRAGAFTEAWIIKEASLKALGTGLDGSPQEFRVHFDDLGHAWPKLFSPHWIFERINISPRYAACLVAVMPQEDGFMSQPLVSSI